MIKVQLILLAFCLLVVAGAELRQGGIETGRGITDAEAFDSYVQLAKQMQHHKHAKTPKPEENTFAVLDREGK